MLASTTASPVQRWVSIGSGGIVHGRPISAPRRREALQRPEWNPLAVGWAGADFGDGDRRIRNQARTRGGYASTAGRCRPAGGLNGIRFRSTRTAAAHMLARPSLACTVHPPWQVPTMSAADRLAAVPRRAGLLLALLPSACLAPLPGPIAESPPVDVAHCQLTPPATTGGRAPGLIVAADVLLPDGHRPDYGVHIRFNGRIGAVADFETVREAYPVAAALDCRGRAVLSPGFVNAHEHPAYSYAFPDASLNPGYAHRDEWRLGFGGTPPLPQPSPSILIRATPGRPRLSSPWSSATSWAARPQSQGPAAFRA